MKYILGIAIGMIIGMIITVIRCGKILEWQKIKVEKNDKTISVVKQFLDNHDKHKDLESFFKNNEMNEIAVYGWGILGRYLIKELEGTLIRVNYVIDNGEQVIYQDRTFYTSEDELPTVDVVVVTVVHDYENIKKQLEQKNMKVISIEEVLGM